MLAGYNLRTTSVVVPDPAADLNFIALVAPFGGLRIHAAYAVLSAAIASDPTNFVAVNLQDGGADGQGTTAMGSVGGANTAWVANTAKALTLTKTELDAGAHLKVNYDEGGVVAPGHLTVIVIWSNGGSE